MALVSIDEILRIAALREGEEGQDKLELFESFLPAIVDELRFRYVRNMKTEKYYIDKKTNTLALPNNVQLLVKVGYQDESDNLVGLGINNKIPRQLLFSNAPEDCNCACDKSCNITNFKVDEVISEDVMVGTTPAKLTTRTITKDNGQIVRIKITPYLDGATLMYKTTEEELCKLEIKSCGCVTNYEEAKVLITDNCGSYSLPCLYKEQTINSGYRLIDGGRKILVHSDFKYDNLVIQYFPVADSKETLAVPIMAKEAVLAGLKYYDAKNNKDTLKFAPTFKQLYDIEKNKLSHRTERMSWDKMVNQLGL